MLKLNAVNLFNAEYAITNVKTEKTVKICDGYYSPLVEEGDYGAEAIILTHPRSLVGHSEITKFIIVYYSEACDNIIQQDYTFDSSRDKRGLYKQVTDLLCEQMKKAWEAYITTDDPHELNMIVERMDVLITEHSAAERCGSCCTTLSINYMKKRYYMVPDDTFNAVCVNYHAHPGTEGVLMSPGNQIDYITEQSDYDYVDDIGFNAERNIKAYIKVPEDGIVRAAKLFYEDCTEDDVPNTVLHLSIYAYDVNAMQVHTKVVEIHIESEKFPNAVKAVKDFRDTIYKFWEATLDAPETISDDWDASLANMAIAFVREEVPTDYGVDVRLSDYIDAIDPEYGDYVIHEFKKG